MQFKLYATLLIVIASLYGWVANLVKLLGVINDPLTLMSALRSVGVLVPPVGAVLGYF